MTVYVDDAFIPADVPNGDRVHSSKWCHLTADSTEELLEFADRLRLRRSWLQSAGKPGEHFDLTMGKRRQAVALGAVEITWREAAKMMVREAARRRDLHGQESSAQ